MPTKNRFSLRRKITTVPKALLLVNFFDWLLELDLFFSCYCAIGARGVEFCRAGSPLPQLLAWGGGGGACFCDSPTPLHPNFFDLNLLLLGCCSALILRGFGVGWIVRRANNLQPLPPGVRLNGAPPTTAKTPLPQPPGPIARFSTFLPPPHTCTPSRIRLGSSSLFSFIMPWTTHHWLFPTMVRSLFSPNRETKIGSLERLAPFSPPQVPPWVGSRHARSRFF